MVKKEIEEIYQYLMMSQTIYDKYGWDGKSACPVCVESVTDIRVFFDYLTSNLNIEPIEYPEITCHPHGGFVLGWEKITRENKKYFFDYLELIFLGNGKVTLESSLEYLGLTNKIELDIKQTLDPVLIQHINYFQEI